MSKRVLIASVTVTVAPGGEVYLTLAENFNDGWSATLGGRTLEPVRIDGKDVLSDPTTLKDPAMVPVRHHFVRQPGIRME